MEFEGCLLNRYTGEDQIPIGYRDNRSALLLNNRERKPTRLAFPLLRDVTDSHQYLGKLPALLFG